MKFTKFSAFLLAFCLLLCACVTQNGNVTHNDPPASDQQHVPDDPTLPEDGSKDPEQDTGETLQPPVYPTALTMELVVEWERTDAVLSRLDALSEQLRRAIEEAGCPLDSVILTISTAGGFTAQALAQGGIDAALLPTLDIVPYEDKTAIIALSAEDVPASAIAVSLANETLSEDFRLILMKALTETESGQDFLATCCDGSFTMPTEESLQRVRDCLAELEESEGRHAE